MTILVVDDYEVNRYQLEILLKANQFEVITAANGAEALMKMRLSRPDVIVSDILMPGMDGFSLCRACKGDEQLKSIPFIFYTATYTDEKDRNFALRLGAELFLVKPQEPEVFLQAVKDVVGRIQHHPPSTQSPMVEAHKERDDSYFQQYSAALIRKLEDKMKQLEEVNRTLELEIATRKKINEQARVSQAHLNYLTRYANDLIILMDEGFHFLEINERVVDLYGYTREELIGMHATQLRAPETRDMFKVDTTMKPGTDKVVFETLHQRKDGTTFPVEISLHQIDVDGKRFYQAILRDITERKRVEQSQRLAQMGQLVALVAHEVNNPLMIISSAAQLSLMEKLDNKEVEGNLKDIIDQCDRAKDMIHRFLMFAKPSKGKVKEVNINDVLENVVRLIEHQFSLYNIKLIRESCKDPIILKVDDQHLQEVFLNILMNAKDAMPKGGRVCIAVSKSGDDACVKIMDTGIGISDENLKKLFDPFFTTKENGVGLGLPVVKGILEAYGGTIKYESVVGKGTTVLVRLPFER